MLWLRPWYVFVCHSLNIFSAGRKGEKSRGPFWSKLQAWLRAQVTAPRVISEQSVTLCAVVTQNSHKNQQKNQYMQKIIIVFKHIQDLFIYSNKPVPYGYYLVRYSLKVKTHMETHTSIFMRTLCHYVRNVENLILPQYHKGVTTAQS